jgi:hypothetical protein
MNKDNNIEQIIDYLDQRMDRVSKERFEAQLQGSASLSAEFEKYQLLVQGLAILGDNKFEQQLQSWETAWQSADSDDGELIDWYLNGQLGEKGALWVDERLETDQAFAQAFRKQKEISDGFELMRSQQFVDQIAGKKEESSPLRVASKNNKRKRSFQIRRIAASALILIALSGLSYFYLHQQFHKTSISLSLYESPIGHNTLGNEAGENKLELAKQMEKAHQLFEGHKYDEAFLSFNRILESIPQLQLDDFNRQYYTEEAEWYRLLAAQAMNTPPIGLQEESSRIANTRGHNHQEEARKLDKKLHSFWYNFIN